MREWSASLLHTRKSRLAIINIPFNSRVSSYWPSDVKLIAAKPAAHLQTATRSQSALLMLN